MPVRKLAALAEAEAACWRDPADPGLWRAIAALWRFSRRVAPQSFVPGVHKYRSLDEAQAAARVRAAGRAAAPAAAAAAPPAGPAEPSRS